MDKKAILNKNYMPYIHRMGKITNTLGVFMGLAPVVYLGFRYGLWPTGGALLQGWINIAAIMASFWIMQPIQFFPILGVAGTYMSNLSGNISNMRVPCAIAAEQAAGVEAGTPEAEICANIANAVSTYVNLIFLTAAVIGGTSLLASLPPNISASLNFLLPTLMGGCVVMVGWDQPRILLIGFSIAIATRLFTVFLLPWFNSFADITSIVITAVVCISLFKAKVFIKV
ncbi:hypothetical protein FACS1894187_07270 [Synergistales bacterium]|nr:hypothetical protein FACS1894187_07270 [Synergistales bacterium]